MCCRSYRWCAVAAAAADAAAGATFAPDAEALGDAALAASDAVAALAGAADADEVHDDDEDADDGAADAADADDGAAPIAAGWTLVNDAPLSQLLRCGCLVCQAPDVAFEMHNLQARQKWRSYVPVDHTNK